MTKDRRLIYFKVAMSKWKLNMTVVVDGEHMYFPIPSVCRALGLEAQRQNKRIQGDPVLSPYWAEYNVQTGRGIKDTGHIRADKMGRWIAKVNAARSSPLGETRLLEFQEDVAGYADTRLWEELGARRSHLRLLPQQVVEDGAEPADPADPTLRDVTEHLAFLEERLGAVEAAQVFVPDDEDAPAQPGDFALTCPHCGGKLWVSIGAGGRGRVYHEDED